MTRFPSIVSILIVIVFISITSLSYGQHTNPEVSTRTEDSDDRLKIRLGFTAVNAIYRQILLTVDDRASINFDWGFDAPLSDIQTDDMSWLIEDEKYVIQGIDSIDIATTQLPLAIKKGLEGLVIISIDALENVPDNLEIYLQDIELGTLHDLRASNYEILLETGEYDNRYRIVFETQTSLGIDDNDINNLKILYNSQGKNLIIQNPNNLSIKHLEIFNISGQSIFNDVEKNTSNREIYQLNVLSSGVYIVHLETSDHGILTRKIIVD